MAPDLDREPGIPRLRRVLGRCVDARTREAIADVRIELRAEPWDGVAQQAQVSTVQTDTEGRFDLGVVCSAAERLIFWARDPDRATVRGMVPGSGSMVDLGDVHLPMGVALDVAVADARFRPLPAMRVAFEQARTGGFRRAFAPEREFELTTGSSGTVPVLRVQPGTWRVRVLGGYTLLGPHSLELKLGASMRTTLMVQVAPDEERIRGRVVAPEHGGVASATVWARDEFGLVAARTTTGPDGSFDLVRSPESVAKSVELMVSGALGFEPGQSAGPVPWGMRGVSIELGSQAPVRIAVVDEEDRPVEAFRVRWRVRLGGRSSSDSAAATSAVGITRGFEHPGGVLNLPLPRGELDLIVLPIDQDLAVSPPMPLLHGSSDTSLRVVLTAAPTQTVEVVDGAGRPVSEAWVEVLRPGAAPVTPTSAAGRPETWGRVGDSEASAVLLWAATTNLEGRAQVRGGQEDGLAVRVRGDTHLTVVRQPVRFGSEPIRVVVERGASVVGTVRPAAVLEALRGGGADAPRVVLEGPSGIRQLSLSARGRFGCFGLAAGSYEMRFEAGRGGAMFRQPWPEPVVFAVGEHRRIHFQIDGLDPASVQGRLILDGRPAPGARFELTPVESGSDVVAGVSGTDGRFDVKHIQAGKYRFSLLLPLPKRPRPVRLVWAGDLLVRPGERLNQEIRIDRGVLRFQLLDHRGKAMGDTALVLVAGQGAMRRACRTDPKGWLRIEPIAAGTYQVALRRPGAQPAAEPMGRWGIDTGELRSVGQVRVGSGSAAVQVLRLPRDY